MNSKDSQKPQKPGGSDHVQPDDAYLTDPIFLKLKSDYQRAKYLSKIGEEKAALHYAQKEFDNFSGWGW